MKMYSNVMTIPKSSLAPIKGPFSQRIQILYIIHSSSSLPKGCFNPWHNILETEACLQHFFDQKTHDLLSSSSHCQTLLEDRKFSTLKQALSPGPYSSSPSSLSLVLTIPPNWPPMTFFCFHDSKPNGSMPQLSYCFSSIWPSWCFWLLKWSFSFLFSLCSLRWMFAYVSGHCFSLYFTNTFASIPKEK